MATIAPVKSSKAHRPEDVPLARYPDGRVFALSLSQPGVTYELRKQPVGWSCPCAGYLHRSDCCHVKAAAERFGMGCYFCGGVEHVDLYRNPYENTPIELCASCAGH